MKDHAVFSKKEEDLQDFDEDMTRNKDTLYATMDILSKENKVMAMMFI